MDLSMTQRYMHLSPATLDAAIGLSEAAAFARGAHGEAAGTGSKDARSYCDKVVEAAGVERERSAIVN